MGRLLILAAEGVRTIVRHPLRSFLTAATCAVAIAVTVNVISLVYGLDEDIRRDAGRFGRRTVDVSRLPVLRPGQERVRLGAAEKEEIEDLLVGLDCVVVGRRLAAGRAAAVADAGKVGVVAVPPTYLATLDVPLAAGRFLVAGDDVDAVCVVDESVAAVAHPGVAVDEVVGRSLTLRIGGGARTRRIVGVLADPLTHRAVFESFDESRSARTLTSALLSFRNVYVPEDALATGSGDEYSGISVVAPTEDAVDAVVDRLRVRWPAVDLEARFPTASIAIFVRRDWMDLLGATSQSGAFLSNIVWIIIVGVAVVMVSTLDLLTIRERYDELAIRRVEGARRGDVAWQITVEGVLLAVAGGLAGLPLGYLGADLLREIVDFPFRFELRYALFATGIAALLGLLAAVLPARHAAGLQPVRVLTRRRT